MAGGSFLTNRELFTNPIWQNIVEFRLFFLIYGNAVFAEEGVRVSDDLVLQRGQWLRSTRKLQEDLKFVENRQVKTYSVSTINRTIQRLVKLQRICTKMHELGTVFTVLNYEQYQGFWQSQTPNLERNLEQSRNNNNNVYKKDKGDICMVSTPHKKIIDYLNEKAGKRFSHKAEPNRKLINGRFNEGRTEDDFYYVIDLKVTEWKDDPKMNQYLRPSTLFCSTNFEKYLNQGSDVGQAADAEESARNLKLERDDAFREWVREGNDPNEFRYEQ